MAKEPNAYLARKQLGLATSVILSVSPGLQEKWGKEGQ